MLPWYVQLYTYTKDVATLLAPIAVAWVGVRGSREFTAIREEVIKAKDAQLSAKDEEVKLVEKHIQQFKDLISKELWEYLPKQKDGLEQIIKDLRSELEETKAKLEAAKHPDTILSDSIVRLEGFEAQLAEREQALASVAASRYPQLPVAGSQPIDFNPLLESMSPGAAAIIMLLMVLFLSKRPSDSDGPTDLPSQGTFAFSQG